MGKLNNIQLEFSEGIHAFGFGNNWYVTISSLLPSKLLTDESLEEELSAKLELEFSTIQKVKCINAKFSDDGSKLMATKLNLLISVYDCRTAKEIWAFEVPIAIVVALSPNGTYFQTFKKPLAL
ncbi:hypothetical protein JHK85_003749 [Glycine max]|nr:hypothetical protein JHK85_003749 [Glycine max]KAG5079519.1 hypothetical protein JHK86_003584 [Glycine max]